MSFITPFRGIRPLPENAPKIASLPYDVLNSREARQMVRDNPLSFLRVVKAEVDLPEDTDIYSDQVYATAKANLDSLIENGHMVQDDTPCLYLYRQIMTLADNREHQQVGVVAGVSIDEYQQGLIKKHEYTRVAKERDRTRHVETLKVDAGPVFLTYRFSSTVDQLVTQLLKNEPACDFTAEDGIRHTFWVIERNEDISAMVDAFSHIPCLYIADGHHRSASGVAVGMKQRAQNPHHTGDEPYNTFLAVIFPDNQMMILDYNRVVMDLNGLSAHRFMEEVSQRFDVVPSPSQTTPSYEHQFGMYLDGRWYMLDAKLGTYDPEDPVGRLDVDILQRNLLDEVLGIGDPRVDQRIDFVGGIRGTDELEKRVDQEGWAVAFSLYPTPIEQLLTIADNDTVMPPKSTWFEPKLRSGLVIKPR